MECLDAEDIVVLNGDTLFPVNLEGMLAQHRESNGLLTIAVKQVTDARRFGRLVAGPEGIITAFLEKQKDGAGLINGGVYIINKALFRRAAGEKFSFEKDLLEPGVGDIQPRAFLSDAYFIDIGIPADYERAQREVGLGRRSGPFS
jgi:D-glycero-alpha-D-manno-heptose 1-phosphate guanylyltransferase